MNEAAEEATADNEFAAAEDPLSILIPNFSLRLMGSEQQSQTERHDTPQANCIPVKANPGTIEGIKELCVKLVTVNNMPKPVTNATNNRTLWMQAFIRCAVLLINTLEVALAA